MNKNLVWRGSGSWIAKDFIGNILEIGLIRAVKYFHFVLSPQNQFFEVAGIVEIVNSSRKNNAWTNCSKSFSAKQG